MDSDVQKTLMAIAGIVIMMITALSLGYDGVLFMSSVAIVSGLGGRVVVDTLKTKKMDSSLFPAGVMGPGEEGK